MTREEITQKAKALADQMLEFGDACTMQHFEESDSELRAVLYLLGEFCRHSSFQISSFAIHTRQ